MKTLKSTIKELALTQKDLKNQRKTVYLIGERSMDTKSATWKHYSNRVNLRYLNVAYGLLRGLQLEQIELKSKEPLDMKYVDKLREQYGNEFRTEESGAINTGDSNG